MSSKNHQIPVIRFKGFTDGWEQHKLRDVGNVVTGSTPSTLDKTNYNGNYLFISPADIQGNRYVDKTITTLSEKGFRKGRILKKGAILFVSIGSTIGKVAQIRQEAVSNQQINAVVPYEDYDENFIFSSLVKESEKIRLLSATQAVPIINKTTFSNIDIHIPENIKEQIQIGAFFNKLDDTIALHQRQLNKYKELKQKMLQKMFPADGQTIPELRFEGFSEEWVWCKLDDISEKVTEKNKKREFTETLTNSAEHGIISQRDFFDKDISNINNIGGYYVVRPDDFVYNPRISNFAPVGPIKRNNLNRIGVMSPLYYVFRIKDILPSFLEKYFATSYWHKFMKLNGDSGARADRFAIKDSIFKEMPIPYPSIEEQVKIGYFFKQVDNAIKLHEQKVSDYNRLKKLMLQQMFV